MTKVYWDSQTFSTFGLKVWRHLASVASKITFQKMSKDVQKIFSSGSAKFLFTYLLACLPNVFFY